MEQLAEKIANWSPILQGALGSALFWIILQILTFLTRKTAALFVSLDHQMHRERSIREWVYRKFTSRSGLAYYPQGYFLTFYNVLKYFLQGFIFVCIALLVGSKFGVVYGICLVGAIYFLLRALVWLVPSNKWQSGSLKHHWERVKKLEEELHGKADDDTVDFLEKASSDEGKD